MLGIDGHVAALGLKAGHQGGQHARFGGRIFDGLERAVHLDGEIIGGGRAGALGVDEVAGDLGDDLLGGDHGGAAQAFHLFAGRCAVKGDRAVYDHTVDRA